MASNEEALVLGGNAAGLQSAIRELEGRKRLYESQTAGARQRAEEIRLGYEGLQFQLSELQKAAAGGYVGLSLEFPLRRAEQQLTAYRNAVEEIRIGEAVVGALEDAITSLHDRAHNFARQTIVSDGATIEGPRQ